MNITEYHLETVRDLEDGNSIVLSLDYYDGGEDITIKSVFRKITFPANKEEKLIEVPRHILEKFIEMIKI